MLRRAPSWFRCWLLALAFVVWPVGARAELAAPTSPLASSIKQAQAGKCAPAAAGLWTYLSTQGTAASDHELAQYVLAECLRELGFWHGAVYFYASVARTRTQPENLPYALRRLEEIARSRPFSERLVYDNLLYNAEFGALPESTTAWVEYVAGMLDYRRGSVDWGEAHFRAIPPTAAHALRADLVRATWMLKDGKSDDALAIFLAIVDSPVDAPAVKNDARWSLARVLFDQGRHEAAQEQYAKIDAAELSLEHAHSLQEQAWNALGLKDFETALKLLHVLEAPAFRSFYFPDNYLLRGLIFKKMCQYLLAKSEVRAFHRQFDSTIEHLRRRVPLSDVRVVRRAVLLDDAVKRRTDFLGSLRKERELVDDYGRRWKKSGFDVALRELYDEELRDQLREWHATFDHVAERVVRDLLDIQEQMDVLDYEIDLDVATRIKDSPIGLVSSETGVEAGDFGTVIQYEFDDEYWNDELRSYSYLLPNRCGGESTDSAY